MLTYDSFFCCGNRNARNTKTASSAAVEMAQSKDKIISKANPKQKKEQFLCEDVVNIIDTFLGNYSDKIAFSLASKTLFEYYFAVKKIRLGINSANNEQTSWKQFFIAIARKDEKKAKVMYGYLSQRKHCENTDTDNLESTEVYQAFPEIASKLGERINKTQLENIKRYPNNTHNTFNLLCIITPLPFICLSLIALIFNPVFTGIVLSSFNNCTTEYNQHNIRTNVNCSNAILPYSLIEPNGGSLNQDGWGIFITLGVILPAVISIVSCCISATAANYRRKFSNSVTFAKSFREEISLVIPEKISAFPQERPTGINTNNENVPIKTSPSQLKN